MQLSLEMLFIRIKTNFRFIDKIIIIDFSTLFFFIK